MYTHIHKFGLFLITSVTRLMDRVCCVSHGVCVCKAYVYVYTQERIRTAQTSFGLFSRVDPQLERDAASKLVAVTVSLDVAGRDLALHVHIGVQRDVQELDGHQRLRVVHLWWRVSITSL